VVILRLKPSAFEDDGCDDVLADARLPELLEDILIHDVIHTGAFELAERHGVVHVVALEFDNVRRAERAPALELVDDRIGHTGGPDSGELFLGLRGASGDE
jgi:hypothetical protein